MADDIENNWGAQALDTEQNARRWQHNVHEGCAVTVGANAMEMDVASGTVAVAGTRHSVGATTVTLSASQSDPRKDVIYVDSSGAVQVAEGQAKPARPQGQTGRDTYQPLPPDLSQMDATPLAEVWVGAGVSDIASGDVSDRRLFADLTAANADVESLSAADSLTDPSGTQHVGELKDATDAPISHASSHQDGGSDELDAAELAGGLGSSGQYLQTNGSSASWVSSSTSVFASETDNFSDVTMYRQQGTDNSFTLVNVTSSGKLLHGEIRKAFDNTGTNVDVTIDGGATQTLTPVRYYDASAWHTYWVIPPTEFETSLKIEVGPCNNTSGYAVVK